MIEAFLANLEEMKSHYTHAISRGNVSSFEEYQNLKGILRGIELAEAEFKELVSKTEGEY